MAIIDSSKTTIQIPDTEYTLFEKTLKSYDPSVREESVGSEKILVSSLNCERLESILGNLTFKVSNTLITITPKGYLYNVPGQDDCFIGVSLNPD